MLHFFLTAIMALVLMVAFSINFTKSFSIFSMIHCDRSLHSAFSLRIFLSFILNNLHGHITFVHTNM